VDGHGSAHVASIEAVAVFVEKLIFVDAKEHHATAFVAGSQSGMARLVHGTAGIQSL
jgi:hypothetical protein